MNALKPIAYHKAQLLLVCCWLLFQVFLQSPVAAQSLPAGFSRVLVANNILNPTVMAFAPDGRIFVAQQNGALRLIKNNALLPAAFLQLNVNARGERGLIGLALDPGFATNQLVYVYYTLPDGSRNRISRFTGHGDVVTPGSEKIILELDPLSSATNHNGGAMHFGPDGKLYVAVGDNAYSAHAQNLDTYHGKILRLNPDGSVPAGNPFTGSAPKSRVWAYGLRNPYTFAIQPGTGKIFLNDVGQNTNEEINDATVGGKNFGWPAAEGNSTNAAYTNPIYSYPHGAGDGQGCAISGGVFFNPPATNYPSAYRGRYFFQDLCNKWINVLDFSGTTATRQPFATDLGSYALSMAVGNDGNLYYLERSTHALYKIIYTTNPAPVITQPPLAVTVAAGQAATFSVTATGTAPLRYQWQKNNVAIAGATAATYTIARTTTADAGAYRVIVSNAAGSATSPAARLTVTAPNQAPVAEILTPVLNALYRGGDTIRFSGRATDAEDGNLPATAFTWVVDFYHDTHHHDGPPVADGAKSGYFVVPQSGEVAVNVWYRLTLTVQDSRGLTTRVYRDIFPRTSTITLATQPAGLRVSLDGQPVTTPRAVNGVEGLQRTIGSIAPQTVGGKTYEFDRWLHGGPATQTIVTPAADVTYTAIYREKLFGPLTLEAEKATLAGPVVATDHAGYRGSGFADYINPTGDYIEWTVSVPAAGRYYLRFKYALAGNDRRLQISVNGTVAEADLAFPGTGGWASWSTAGIITHLNAGPNKIRAMATGTSGPNIDYLVVTGARAGAPTAHSLPVAGNDLPNEGTTLVIRPNPVRDQLAVDVALKKGEKVEVSLLSTQGEVLAVYPFTGARHGLNTFRLDGSQWRNGMYILRLRRAAVIESRLIVVDH